MYGEGAYHASDLAETNYAKVAEALGCTGIRVEEPDAVGPALEQAFRTRGPVVIDVVVTRDPAKMLPAVDNRTVQVRKGDRWRRPCHSGARAKAESPEPTTGTTSGCLFVYLLASRRQGTVSA